MLTEKLSEDLVLALEWAATETKYLIEMNEGLERINASDSESVKKQLKNAARILRYVCRAQRRVFKYEELVKKDSEEVYKELSEKLGFNFSFKHELMQMIKEIGLETNALVKYASKQGGLLKDELTHEGTEALVLVDIEEPSEEERRAIAVLLRKIQKSVEDAEKWALGLEQSLRKAQRLVEKFSKQDQEYLLSVGLTILKKNGWSLPEDDSATIALAKHPASLQAIVGTSHWLSSARSIFVVLADVKELIDEKTVLEIAKTITIIGPSQVKSFFTEELPKFKEKLTWEQTKELFIEISESNAFYYFRFEEVFNLFYFMQRLVLLVEKEDAEIVYAIDRGGRILGFLFYFILKNLNLLKRGVFARRIFYFMQIDDLQNVVFYSQKQQKEIEGKRVMVIDEFLRSGRTMNACEKTLRSLVGSRGKVIPCAFSSLKGGYYSVFSSEPSWYLKKSYSGMREKEKGGVEIEKGYQSIASSVRLVLIKLGGSIAKYVRYVS